jgi:hypothetical protein
MTPTELWLPLGAIAFHLYDATQGLWHNEVLFERAAKGWRIRADSPVRRWGRRLLLPNLFTPQRPLFRVAWSITDTRPAGNADLALLFHALRPVGVICQLLLLMLLALWPLCWLLGAGLTVLVLFAAYYLLVVAALVLVFRRRVALGLTTGACWALAFDVLACAPFAVNLVRRVSLHHGLAGDPLQFASRQFSRETCAQFATLLRSRLEESRAGAACSTAEAARIAHWLARLETAER